MGYSEICPCSHHIKFTDLINLEMAALSRYTCKGFYIGQFRHVISLCRDLIRQYHILTFLSMWCTIKLICGYALKDNNQNDFYMVAFVRRWAL